MRTEKLCMLILLLLFSVMSAQEFSMKVNPDSVYSDTTSVQDIQKDASIPGNVSIDASVDNVYVAWDEVTGAVSYNIYSSFLPYSGFSLETTVTANEYNSAESAQRKFYYIVANLDSIDTTVYITYNGTEVSVTNPLELLGVSVSVSGADVIVNSTSDISNINYVLSGTTSDGMFKIYSDSTRIDLRLNNVNITNANGPAINVQSDKRVTVYLEDGTMNILGDGVTYAASPNGEDQDAAFFSEGQLVFEGNGTLVINGIGADEHGLRSDDYIKINSGNIVVNSAVKDGIHANDGFFMTGGSVDVTSTSDGIDGSDGTVEITGGNIAILNTVSDKCAMKCDSTLYISGGSINITVEGDQSKGLDSGQEVMITGGILDITTTGGVVLEPYGLGYDPSYCTAIKADNEVLIESCTITINTSGIAGRGISCDSLIVMNSGTVEITSSGDGNTYTDELGETDVYHGPCIKADYDLTVTGGELTLNHSGAAGKGISAGDINFGTAVSVPVVNVTTTGADVVISKGGFSKPGPPPDPDPEESAEAKAVRANDTVTIENGDITISSADDGIKATTGVYINGGTLNITNSYESIEAPNIIINDGNITVNAEDDALNATYGSGGEENDGSNLTINGGYFCGKSNGDTVDSNGNFTMNGGVLVAHGAPAEPELGMDVNGNFLVNGGFMVVSEIHSFMSEVPLTSSVQNSAILTTSWSISAGTLFHIENTSGTSLLTFAPASGYTSIIFSSSDLNTGTSYRVYTGGSCSGSETNGLYTGGTYSGGTLKTTFTQTSRVQTVTF